MTYKWQSKSKTNAWFEEDGTVFNENMNEGRQAGRQADYM